MKEMTIERLIADQKERIERNNDKYNEVIQFIEEINGGLENNH